MVSSGFDAGSERALKRYRPIIKITGIYLIFAGAWILFSDQVLAWLIPNPETYIRAQTAKGWFFVLITAIILYRTMLQEFRLHWEYERELEIIATFSKDIRGILDLQRLSLKILSLIRGLFKAETVFFGEPDPLTRLIKFTFLNPDNEVSLQYFPAESPLVKLLFEENQTLTSLKNNAGLVDPEFPISANQKYVISPLIASEKAIGVIGFMKSGELISSDVHLMQAVSEISSQAFYAADLLHNNATQIRRLSSFRKIDDSILSLFSTENLVELLLKEFTGNLNTDAAAITVINPETQQLEFYSFSGMEFQEEPYLSEASVYVQGCDSILVIQNAKTGIHSQRTYPLHHPIHNPELIGYALAPLRNVGQLLGAVEVFSKKEIQWDRENVQFFEALAKQTAIAIDKANMVLNLKKSNEELIKSYEETLEGWSRALDIRDHETENHTQRVTSLTIRMGKELGLSEQQLVQMRRGALLHDIGKLGIPDNILLKEGGLTDEEWTVMRRHPLTALELLKPIAFLAPAITIPYFHHEKWDGSGYPQGLRGGEIPIEARIFSIVDVWDALTCDRPYRKALPPFEAAAYLYSQSGKHFDPQIVSTFLKLLVSEGLLSHEDILRLGSR
jgi:HD-GYP domain-containing protein (c-di-GMP phosphodiesterase class II)